MAAAVPLIAVGWRAATPATSVMHAPPCCAPSQMSAWLHTCLSATGKALYSGLSSRSCWFNRSKQVTVIPCWRRSKARGGRSPAGHPLLACPLSTPRQPWRTASYATENPLHRPPKPSLQCTRLDPPGPKVGLLDHCGAHPVVSQHFSQQAGPQNGVQQIVGEGSRTGEACGQGERVGWQTTAGGGRAGMPEGHRCR